MLMQGTNEQGRYYKIIYVRVEPVEVLTVLPVLNELSPDR
jgi:hypothetical protein